MYQSKKTLKHNGPKVTRTILKFKSQQNTNVSNKIKKKRSKMIYFENIKDQNKTFKT